MIIFFHITEKGLDYLEKSKIAFTAVREFLKGLKESEQNNEVETSSSVFNYQEQEIIDMKGITKRTDGRYQIQLQKNGIRKITYAPTLELAKKQLSKLKKQDFKKETKKEKKIEINYTFEQWYLIWLKEYKEKFVGKETFSMIKSAIKKILPVFKNINLKDITTNQIQEELNKLPHNRTKERICIYFNAILEKAFEQRIIDRNPFKSVIKEKKIQYRNNAFTFAEQETIISNAEKYNIKPEILIYLMTGCRPNEIPKKEYFDFEQNIVHIYGTKTANAEHRIIEMSNEFAQYIKNYLETNEIKTQSYIKNQFSKLCEENNIENYKLYKLRHTFATNHFTIGTPAKYVQHWLGHYSVELTLDTYTDIDRTSSKEKIKKLYNNFYYEK